MPKSTPSPKKSSGIIVNYKRAGEILLVLNEWRSLRFKDTLVSVRISKLIRLLDAELKPVREELEKAFDQIKEEHGSIDGRGKRVLMGGSDGARLYEKESERVMQGGSIEITECFRQDELDYRVRNPQTKEVSEYAMDLGPDDIDALGVDEIIVLRKAENGSGPVD